MSGPNFPYTGLDADQVIKQVFDEENDRLRVHTEIATTIAGEAEVAITADDDSIKIGNTSSGPFLNINPDGSINVNVITGSGTATYRNIYTEASSVVSGATTSIGIYTVPSGKTGILQRIEVSGENIAAFKVLVNGSPIAKKRTFFGNSLNEVFEFIGDSEDGYPLTTGDIVLVQVLHNRPDPGDFNSRIQILES